VPPTIINPTPALRTLRDLNAEIAYRGLIDLKRLRAGLISFKPRKKADAKWIRHRDKDVLCQVLRGRGKLRIGNRRFALKKGTICHIPRGTPHDFAAAGEKPLVLFYSLIGSD
jgi:mannose-6-phosphate isomerase-like protein (cupin superfamily)